MIIPMKPENVRITIQLTSADFAAGEFVHDINLQKLYENRNSCAYEFAIDYGGQFITNAYQLFYDDGTLYAAVFFTSTDGGTVKLTLSEGEGTIATSSTDLPSVSGSDNGKVLTVVEGAWGAADPASDLPSVTSADEGDVLTVNGSGEWVNAEPASQLPAVTGTDDGKVLMVSSGAWSAQNPSGGLELYGPYYATNENAYTTTSSTTIFNITLGLFSDYNENPVDIPGNVEGVTIFSAVFFDSTGDGSFIYGVDLPSCSEEDGAFEWQCAHAHLYKYKDPQEGTTTIPAEGVWLMFYSTVEFPIHTEPEP